MGFGFGFGFWLRRGLSAIAVIPGFLSDNNVWDDVAVWTDARITG